MPVPPPQLLLSALQDPLNQPQPGAGRCHAPQSPPVFLLFPPLGESMEMIHFILTIALQAGTVSPYFTDEENEVGKGKRLAYTIPVMCWLRESWLLHFHEFWEPRFLGTLKPTVSVKYLHHSN